MTRLRTTGVVVAVAVGLVALLAGDAATTAIGERSDAAKHAPASWTEVKWPFPLDQWGTGRAFQCRSDGCGAEITLYLRPKLGFCNCTTGVSDDAELDRVGDLELFSEKFDGLSEGRPIKVGWMNGRSRPYRVALPYEGQRTVLAIAFNDKCDVVVASVTADRDRIPAVERAALDFLNSDLVLRWAERELGL
jgi:hypothetical protein